MYLPLPFNFRSQPHVHPPLKGPTYDFHVPVGRFKFFGPVLSELPSLLHLSSMINIYQLAVWVLISAFVTVLGGPASFYYYYLT